MGWEYLIVFIIALAVSVAASFLLRPKGPPPPAPATLDDVEVPVAEEGKVIGVVFGTVDIEEHNVEWYGNFYAEPIRKGGGGKK